MYCTIHIFANEEKIKKGKDSEQAQLYVTSLLSRPEQHLLRARRLNLLASRLSRSKSESAQSLQICLEAQDV